jgi:hypothetical protein
MGFFFSRGSSVINWLTSRSVLSVVQPVGEFFIALNSGMVLLGMVCLSRSKW